MLTIGTAYRDVASAASALSMMLDRLASVALDHTHRMHASQVHRVTDALETWAACWAADYAPEPIGAAWPDALEVANHA